MPPTNLNQNPHPHGREMHPTANGAHHHREMPQMANRAHHNQNHNHNQREVHEMPNGGHHNNNHNHNHNHNQREVHQMPNGGHHNNNHNQREVHQMPNGGHHNHNQNRSLTAPPPPPQRHHAYYPRSSSSSSASLKGCCCCLFLLFSFLALLVLAVVLIIVLAVKPKKPQFDLQQVGVQYMGISTSTPSSFDGTATAVAATAPTTASLSLTIHMLFTAVNPNKVGIKYGESKFTVMYRGIPLGKASVPGFYQDAHSKRNVEATIAVDRANLMQADAADLIRDASLYDRVELRVLGDVGAKIRVMDFDSPGVQVSVDCAIVISPRKQSLTYKQCGFDGLSV